MSFEKGVRRSLTNSRRNGKYRMNLAATVTEVMVVA